MSTSAIEVTVYSNGSDSAAIDRVVSAYGQYDTDGVDIVTTQGDLDDVLREAVAKADSTQGKDLIVVVTKDGSHDDRDSATQSLKTLADDGNMVVIVTTGSVTDDVRGYLSWADDDAPFADNVDVLTVDQLPGSEVADWAKKAAA